MPQPQIRLHTLSHASGSATYTRSENSTTIICGVNFPLEVPRRSDELPDSLLIDVNVRPHNGVGQVRERHIETLIGRTLRAVTLTDRFPRQLMQVTLQVVDVDADEDAPGGERSGGGGQGESYLGGLSGLLNASVAGCLDAGVPMRESAVAVLVGLSSDRGRRRPVIEPGTKEQKRCSSLHVFAFGSRGSCLLMESEGRFSIDEWEEAEAVAREACLGGISGDIEMGGAGLSQQGRVLDALRTSVEARVAIDDRWKNG